MDERIIRGIEEFGEELAAIRKDFSSRAWESEIHGEFARHRLASDPTIEAISAPRAADEPRSVKVWTHWVLSKDGVPFGYLQGQAEYSYMHERGPLDTVVNWEAHWSFLGDQVATDYGSLRHILDKFGDGCTAERRPIGGHGRFFRAIRDSGAPSHTPTGYPFI